MKVFVVTYEARRNETMVNVYSDREKALGGWEAANLLPGYGASIAAIEVDEERDWITGERLPTEKQARLPEDKPAVMQPGHMHWTEPQKVIAQYTVSPRWCFTCQARREFVQTTTAPVDMMSYYGPQTTIRCAVCKTLDGDLFPGREREWGE